MMEILNAIPWMEILLAVVVVELGFIWWGMDQVFGYIQVYVDDTNAADLKRHQEVIGEMSKLRYEIHAAAVGSEEFLTEIIKNQTSKN